MTKNVLPSNLDRPFGNVQADASRLRNVDQNRNRNAGRPYTHFAKPGIFKISNQPDGSLGQHFGLRPRDEDRRRDHKLQAVKLFLSGYIVKRLSPCPSRYVIEIALT